MMVILRYQKGDGFDSGLGSKLDVSRVSDSQGTATRPRFPFVCKSLLVSSKLELMVKFVFTMPVFLFRRVLPLDVRNRTLPVMISSLE